MLFKLRIWRRQKCVKCDIVDYNYTVTIITDLNFEQGARNNIYFVGLFESEYRNKRIKTDRNKRLNNMFSTSVFIRLLLLPLSIFNSFVWIKFLCHGRHGCSYSDKKKDIFWQKEKSPWKHWIQNYKIIRNRFFSRLSPGVY